MAYSNFTLAKVKEDFGLAVDQTQNLFADIEAVKPSELLTITLQEYIPLATAIGTEKARSELLIAPILTEVRRQLNYQISLFSGVHPSYAVSTNTQAVNGERWIMLRVMNQ